MIRKVYMFEAYTYDGILKTRQFARNKKIIERLNRKFKDTDPTITDVTEEYKAGLISRKNILEK